MDPPFAPFHRIERARCLRGFLTLGVQNLTDGGSTRDRRRGLVGSGLLGGPDLLVWIVLALGAAMVVGNLLAIFRPPHRPQEDDLATAPVARSIIMAVIGAMAAIWALASLRGLNARPPDPRPGSGGLVWCGGVSWLVAFAGAAPCGGGAGGRRPCPWTGGGPRRRYGPG